MSGFACMHVYCKHNWYPWRSKEGTRSLEQKLGLRASVSVGIQPRSSGNPEFAWGTHVRQLTAAYDSSSRGSGASAGVLMCTCFHTDMITHDLVRTCYLCVGTCASAHIQKQEEDVTCPLSFQLFLCDETVFLVEIETSKPQRFSPVSAHLRAGVTGVCRTPDLCYVGAWIQIALLEVEQQPLGQHPATFGM